ncbi:MAG TPA: xanthine dehydrogenase family protein subunit M [Stellaceae bacterium]|nr:xanthine dehydrogenase family protein subunit M [Stellaceae bacterium]
MPSLSFTAPTTVDEAINALARAPGLAKPLAGGTDLLVQMRSGRMRPEVIVDIKRIPDLIGIRDTGDSFVVGAATPGVMLSEHEVFARAWPGIVEGVDLIGSQQIQGRASLVGNLCNASPAADSVPALICARAVAVIAGPDGKREAPVEAIVTGPGQTSLKKGEFIVEFRVPKPKPRQSDAYLRFIPRTEMDIAVVGCGVNVTLDAAGLCTDARVVLGAVAPTQVIVDEAAEALRGHRLDDDTLSRLDTAAQRACKPINDKRGTIEYRTKVAGVLARRAAAIAFERAAGRVAGVH